MKGVFLFGFYVEQREFSYAIYENGGFTGEEFENLNMVIPWCYEHRKGNINGKD